MAIRILVIEDEKSISEMICFALEQHGYETANADNYGSAWAEIAHCCPDLILLDWMLPGGLNGIQLLKQLKSDKRSAHIPVVMLTARGEEDDRVCGLELGADDYIVKPFSPKELLARIKAVMRRVTPALVQGLIEVDGLCLDPIAHRVCVEGSPVPMGPSEFNILHFFMTHQDRVYSREQLLNHIWGVNVYVEDRTVDVHIRRLRKALEVTGHDRLIQTVRGSGYRFSAK